MMQISTTSAFAFGTIVAGTAAAGTAIVYGFDGVTAAMVSNASRMFVQTSGTITYRYDGGTPGTAVGHFLYGATALSNNSGRLEIVGANNIRRFHVIAASGSPVIFITLEG